MRSSPADRSGRSLNPADDLRAPATPRGSAQVTHVPIQVGSPVFPARYPARGRAGCPRPPTRSSSTPRPLNSLRGTQRPRARPRRTPGPDPAARPRAPAPHLPGGCAASGRPGAEPSALAVPPSRRRGPGAGVSSLPRHGDSSRGARGGGAGCARGRPGPARVAQRLAWPRSSRGVQSSGGDTELRLSADGCAKAATKVTSAHPGRASRRAGERAREGWGLRLATSRTLAEAKEASERRGEPLCFL